MVEERIIFIGWTGPKDLSLKVVSFGISNNDGVSFILPFVDPLQDYKARMREIIPILPLFEYFFGRTDKKLPYA